MAFFEKRCQFSSFTDFFYHYEVKKSNSNLNILKLAQQGIVKSFVLTSGLQFDKLRRSIENDYHYREKMTQKPIEKLKEYIETRNLRWTAQRQVIADILFESGQHLTTDELFQRAKKLDSAIGYATVSRTLHLLTEAGFCDKIDFSDGFMRYEVLTGRTHHDHLVCTQCGIFIEVFSPELEKIQAELVRQHDFTEDYHKLQIFGLCKKCSNKNPNSD